MRRLDLPRPSPGMLNGLFFVASVVLLLREPQHCGGKAIVAVNGIEQGGGARSGLFDDKVIDEAVTEASLQTALVGKTVKAGGCTPILHQHNLPSLRASAADTGVRSRRCVRLGVDARRRSSISLRRSGRARQGASGSAWLSFPFRLHEKAAQNFE